MPICKATGCETQIESGLLMCKMHWFMAPEPLRLEVWREYRKEPLSNAHMHACYKVQLAVAVKEGRISQEEMDKRIVRGRQLAGII